MDKVHVTHNWIQSSGRPSTWLAPPHSQWAEGVLCWLVVHRDWRRRWGSNALPSYRHKLNTQIEFWILEDNGWTWLGKCNKKYENSTCGKTWTCKEWKIFWEKMPITTQENVPIIVIHKDPLQIEETIENVNVNHRFVLVHWPLTSVVFQWI